MSTRRGRLGRAARSIQEKSVARKPDEAKRQQLVNALVSHALSHGLQDTTLQTLAEATGTSPRMLIHYFGSAERMRTEVIQETGRSFRALIQEMPPEDLKTPDRFVNALWAVLISPQYQRAMRVFFELYGMALQDPERHDDFARRSVNDYMEPLARLAENWGVPKANRASVATMILGLGRAFSADFLATRDRKRISETVAWAADLLAREIKTMTSPNRAEARRR
jgi:AcrR family transcriptional regulator